MSVEALALQPETEPEPNRHYLVVSDLHLCDIEDHADGWKSYKSSRFVFDEDLAALLERFRERNEGGGAQLTLVLNGDIFDFDLVADVPEDPPWPVSRSERKRGLNATEEKSLWKLQRILADHPRFIRMLAEFLAAGHDVVYVLGNHDREFCFPALQRELSQAVEAQAAAAGAPLRGALRYEPWFFYARGALYVEHGHQFDYYTAFKNQLAPVVQGPEGPLLALPMGNMANRYLLTRMGFFNPHASDYILDFFSYIGHWLRHYAFSRRSLLFAWLWGSLAVVARMLRQKKQLFTYRGPHTEQLRDVADRYEVTVEVAKQLNRLHRRPITNRFYRIVREFWLDRALIALLMTGGTIALALVPIPLWIKLMVPLSSFPLLYFVYDQLAAGETIFSVATRLPEWARCIALELPVRVISFGHTHRPRTEPLSRGVAFVDTGTWAPVTVRSDLDELVPGLRTYLEVSVRGDDVTARLDSWMA